jgi:RNase P subunit RPR2
MPSKHYICPHCNRVLEVFVQEAVTFDLHQVTCTCEPSGRTTVTVRKEYVSTNEAARRREAWKLKLARS